MDHGKVGTLKYSMDTRTKREKKFTEESQIKLYYLKEGKKFLLKFQ